MGLPLDENFVLFRRPTALPESRIKVIEPSLATLFPDTSLDAIGYLRPTRHFFRDALDDFLVFLLRPRTFHKPSLSHVGIQLTEEKCYVWYTTPRKHQQRGFAETRKGQPQLLKVFQSGWIGPAGEQRGLRSVKSGSSLLESTLYRPALVPHYHSTHFRKSPHDFLPLLTAAWPAAFGLSFSSSLSVSPFLRIGDCCTFDLPSPDPPPSPCGSPLGRSSFSRPTLDFAARRVRSASSPAPSELWFVSDELSSVGAHLALLPLAGFSAPLSAAEALNWAAKLRWLSEIVRTFISRSAFSTRPSTRRWFDLLIVACGIHDGVAPLNACVVHEQGNDNLG